MKVPGPIGDDLTEAGGGQVDADGLVPPDGLGVEEKQAEKEGAENDGRQADDRLADQCV